jgi:hypothetical protein
VKAPGIYHVQRFSIGPHFLSVEGATFYAAWSSVSKAGDRVRRQPKAIGVYFAVDEVVVVESLRVLHGSTENHSNPRYELER